VVAFGGEVEAIEEFDVFDVQGGDREEVRGNLDRGSMDRIHLVSGGRVDDAAADRGAADGDPAVGGGIGCGFEGEFVLIASEGVHGGVGSAGAFEEFEYRLAIGRQLHADIELGVDVEV